MKSIIGRITSIRSLRLQSKAVSVGFHGSRERGGCYLLLATLPKTLGGCYAKLPKTESLYALRSSEICTVLNVVTEISTGCWGQKKAIFKMPLKRARKKETKSHDGWDINDSTRPVSGCTHQWFQLTSRCSWVHLPSMLETWIKFTPGCLLSDKINQLWKVVKNQIKSVLNIKDQDFKL